ncbi:hypothetical protein CVT26_013861 [Gymnopilus dilepis]|uniref:MYND-type domain-containing protein n=1 Tax=Gymnopilus dilepis TaxID=231916 RepID=A0A409WSU3_9AGAR|nr:hypothetical protein CVT26_013861 [Gymnopilus dilepis]
MSNMIIDYAAGSEEGLESHGKPVRLRACRVCSRPVANIRECARVGQTARSPKNTQTYYNLKCKAVKYCSRECQKKDWPSHKDFCARAAESDLITYCRLMDRFYNDDFLSLYLEMAIMIKLKGLKIKVSIKNPVSVDVLIGFEPVHTSHIESLATSPTLDEGSHCPLGMLQVLGIKPSNKSTDEIKAMPVYRDSRPLFDLDPELKHSPLVVVNMEYLQGRHDRHYTNQKALLLSAAAILELHTVESLTIPSLRNGEDVKKPLTSSACLELINMHIRRDDDNKYRLRKRVQWGDMKMINLALHGRSIDDGESKLFSAGWINKFLQEDVYRNLSCEELDTQRLQAVISAIA